MITYPVPIPTQESLKIFKGKAKLKWGVKGFFSEVTELGTLPGGIAPKAVVVTSVLNAAIVTIELVNPESLKPTARLRATVEQEIGTEVEVNWVALV